MLHAAVVRTDASRDLRVAQLSGPNPKPPPGRLHPEPPLRLVITSPQKTHPALPIRENSPCQRTHPFSGARGGSEKAPCATGDRLLAPGEKVSRRHRVQECGDLGAHGREVLGEFARHPAVRERV